MSETLARHGMGGNTPPLTELLTEQYADLLRDAEELVASAGRAPRIVADDDTLGKFGKLVVQIRNVTRRVEAAHKTEKEPYLSGGRAVDGFFKAIIARMAEAAAGLERVQSAYVAAKEVKIRQEQREAEELARAETEARLQAAQQAQASGDEAGAKRALASAVEAEAVADNAAALAEARPADLVRTYATSGNVVSSQERWEFEITSRAEIPLEAIRAFIRPAEIESAVKAFVKAGGRELKGVRIYETRKVLNRG